MQGSPSLIFQILIMSGVMGIIAIVIGFHMRKMKHSRLLTAVSALPAMLMLVLFYSLAIHMYWSLGGWPKSIGEAGFPGHLLIHVNITCFYFIILVMVNIFVWPVAFLLCLIIRRWRYSIYYLAVYSLSCYVCLGAMLLAPSQFLYWWWD